MLKRSHGVVSGKRVKVFTWQKVVSPPGVTLSRKKVILPPGWPFPQGVPSPRVFLSSRESLPPGVPSPRVSLPPGWPFLPGSPCPRVFLPPGYPFPQGDPSPRVSLPPGCSFPQGDPFSQGVPTTRGKCEICHINARSQGEVKLIQNWLA